MRSFCFLAGDDMVNCLKQAVQFGLDKKTHIAGAQQELEVNLALPPEALLGDWCFEWYWKQPGVPHVEKFVADIRKKSGGHVPTARTWFGYAATWTCKLAAEKAKSLDAVKMAKAMQGLVLPPEVALMPNDPFYREGDNQLMPTLFVGTRKRLRPAATRKTSSRSPIWSRAPMRRCRSRRPAARWSGRAEHIKKPGVAIYSAVPGIFDARLAK